MKKLTLLIVTMALTLTSAYTQVAINTDGSSANTSAMLDVKSTTKGMLIPRMTTTQRDAITSPAQGLMVYVTDDSTFYYYKKTSWIKIGKGVSGWDVNGNKIYTLNDSVGIGTSTPTHKLHIKSTTTNNILRLEGKYNYGSGAKLNFGDGDYVYMQEDLDDHLKIYADQRIKLISPRIAINRDDAEPDNSAILDVNSDSKGMLIPRMTTARRNAISWPAQGLTVYDTDDSTFYYYKKTNWIKVGKGASGWDVNGNGIYTSNYSVGIGTSAPQAKLDVENNSADKTVQIHTGTTSSNPIYGIYSTFNAGGTGKQFGLYTEFSGTGSGNLYGSYDSIYNTGASYHYGSYNYLSGTGGGEQYGIKNTINNSGNNDHYGIYNFLWGSGTGTHYGSYNDLWGSGSGEQYGTKNTISNVSNEKHYGVANKLFGSGSGKHFGCYNELSGTGSGNQYGSYDSIYNTGDGDHYGNYTVLSGSGSGFYIGNYNHLLGSGENYQIGTYNDLNGTGTGGHYGTYNSLYGTGTGTQYGTQNIIYNSNNSTHYGIYNDLSGSGTGTHYGIKNYVRGAGTGAQYGNLNAITNSNDTTHYGTYNDLSGTGSGKHYGTFNALSGSGSGYQYGIKNDISNTNNTNHYGCYNNLTGTGTGIHYGNYNSLSGAGTGTHIGVMNSVTGSGTGAQYGTSNYLNNSANDGLHYGTYNFLGGIGTSTKYGSYNLIPTSAGGTHYGIYSAAQGHGNYAGYFVGNSYVSDSVGIGTTTPHAKLEVNGDIVVGAGTGTPVAGTIRWNSTTHEFEGYNGTNWVSLSKTYGGWGDNTIHESEGAVSSDGAADDYFGYSVSIDGDYAIVGAYLKDVGSNSYQGKAYIFHRSGTTWSQQAPLTASDGAEQDFFGVSVSISGDYAIVGASGKNYHQGKAYIFHRSGTTWSQQAPLTASDGAAGDYFGASVSIDGDYAIVGANWKDVGGNSKQGKVYIYHRSGTSWGDEVRKTASDGAANDEFGGSVSINGDYAIVGAFGKNSNQGKAYIFYRSGTTWSQQSPLTASDGAADDYFGWSVSIDGDYAIVGADHKDVGGNSDQGKAYIFHRSGTSWGDEVGLTASDGEEGDNFGHNVSINGDYAIVGAYQKDVGGNSNQGKAYIFHRNGTSWSEGAGLTASDGAANDFFGRGVSIDGDYAIVGAYRKEVGGNSHQGKIYFFYRN